MRLGQAESHVHVVRVRRERTLEDGHHEARIDGVHHEIDAIGPGERLHGVRIRGVDLGDRMARGVADRVRHLARPIKVVAGEHHLLQPWPTGAQARDGLSDGTEADQKDLHVSRCSRCWL